MSENSLIFPISSRWSPRLQRNISHLFFIVWWPLLSIYFYLFQNAKLKRRREIREQFHQIFQSSKVPIVVCSNHLTLVDSIVVQYYLGSYVDYFKYFDKFIWSFPDSKNFYGNLFLKVLTYLGKCIHVSRGAGGLNRQNIKDHLNYFSSSNHVISIFPEGTRSRSGYFDFTSITYGTGELLHHLQEYKVVCFYLRGKSQVTYSNFPKRGEVFNAKLEEIKVNSDLKGRKKHRDLSQKISNHLKKMETSFFEENKDWSRPCLPQK